MLTIYGPLTSRTMGTVWGAEEAGVPYELKSLSFIKGEHKSDSYLNINPAGKVPAIDDDGFTLTESAAILTYFGDHYAEPDTLTPKFGTLDRARYNQWMFFTLTELETPLWTTAKHKFMLPKNLRLANIRPSQAFDFSRAYRVLERGLADNPYILGDCFSMADVLLGHTLSWAKMAKFDTNSDIVTAYHQRLMLRPAFGRALSKNAT